MSIRTNITDYAHGEAFLPLATLTRDGDPVTSGTVEMRFALTEGGTAVATVPGSHGGEGIWAFDASAAAQSVVPESGKVYWEIWETGSDRQFAHGMLAARRSISS